MDWISRSKLKPPQTIHTSRTAWGRSFIVYPKIRFPHLGMLRLCCMMWPAIWRPRLSSACQRLGHQTGFEANCWIKLSGFLSLSLLGVCLWNKHHRVSTVCTSRCSQTLVALNFEKQGFRINTGGTTSKRLVLTACFVQLLLQYIVVRLTFCELPFLRWNRDNIFGHHMGRRNPSKSVEMYSFCTYPTYRVWSIDVGSDFDVLRFFWIWMIFFSKTWCAYCLYHQAGLGKISLSVLVPPFLWRWPQSVASPFKTKTFRRRTPWSHGSKEYFCVSPKRAFLWYKNDKARQSSVRPLVQERLALQVDAGMLAGGIPALTAEQLESVRARMHPGCQETDTVVKKIAFQSCVRLSRSASSIYLIYVSNVLTIYLYLTF